MRGAEVKLQRNGQLRFNKYFYELYYKNRVKFYAFGTKRTNEQFGQSFVLFLSQNLGGNGRDTSVEKIGESFALFYSFKKILGAIDSLVCDADPK